jgi:hypothetical protein
MTFFVTRVKNLLSEAVIPKEFQGFANVVHGGILGTLLDEVLVNLYWLRGIPLRDGGIYRPIESALSNRT